MKTHSEKGGSRMMLIPEDMAEAFRLGQALGMRGIKSRAAIPDGPCSLRVVVGILDMLQLAPMLKDDLKRPEPKKKETSDEKDEKGTGEDSKGDVSATRE